MYFYSGLLHFSKQKLLQALNYFLDLCPLFHLIEFKFKLSFSFSKMSFTISSLNTNYY